MIFWMTCMANKTQAYECPSFELRDSLPARLLRSLPFFGFSVWRNRRSGIRYESPSTEGAGGKGCGDHRRRHGWFPSPERRNFGGDPSFGRRGKQRSQGSVSGSVRQNRRERGGSRPQILQCLGEESEKRALVQEIKRRLDSKVKFATFNPVFFGSALAVLVSCASSRHPSSPSDEPKAESGFELGQEVLAEKRTDFLRQGKKLALELDWLKLRTRVAQASYRTNQARLAENALAQEMARFGSLDRRFPDSDGFIDPIQRKGWDARLLQRQEEVSQAEARERLLAREMRELRALLAKEGFPVPDQSAFDLSLPSNR